MSGASRDDSRSIPRAVGRSVGSDGNGARGSTKSMNAFVESCVGTVADSAVAVQRRSRGHQRAHRLLRVLAEKRNILVTTHCHPDPDALAASLGILHLLRLKLPQAKVTVSVKGRIGGGINDAFFKQTDVKLTPWDDAALKHYDAIVLLDTQPAFAYSPLPSGTAVTAVIDHHRPGRGRRPKCPFCDIRTEVGASASIVFSYLMEMEVPIPPDLSAVLLFAIESDLAGAAGTPGELDNIALARLTLTADTNRLYKMRYVDLPQSYYIAYSAGLNNAMWYDNAITSYLGPVDSLEKPAVLADFLLRFDQVQWALVTGVIDGNLILSLRAGTVKMPAADMMRKLVRRLGEGGGHYYKAGGLIPLGTGTTTEIERLRTIIRRRFLKALGIHQSRGQRLVPANL